MAVVIIQPTRLATTTIRMPIAALLGSTGRRVYLAAIKLRTTIVSTSLVCRPTSAQIPTSFQRGADH